MCLKILTFDVCGEDAPLKPYHSLLQMSVGELSLNVTGMSEGLVHVWYCTPECECHGHVWRFGARLVLYVWVRMSRACLKVWCTSGTVRLRATHSFKAIFLTSQLSGYVTMTTNLQILFCFTMRSLYVNYLASFSLLSYFLCIKVCFLLWCLVHSFSTYYVFTIFTAYRDQFVRRLNFFYNSTTMAQYRIKPFYFRQQRVEVKLIKHIYIYI